MGIEIERKFLVNHDAWGKINKPEGKRYRQGYILSDETRTVRIRVADDAAFITLKGRASGISRSEFEYPIPVNDGQAILDEMATSSVEKTRYGINYAGNLWEVDVFTGDNSGLIVAEIELTAPNQQFEKPHWVGQEVSDDGRYTNAALSIYPYRNWAP